MNCSHNSLVTQTRAETSDDLLSHSSLRRSNGSSGKARWSRLDAGMSCTQLPIPKVYMVFFFFFFNWFEFLVGPLKREGFICCYVFWFHFCGFYLFILSIQFLGGFFELISGPYSIVRKAGVKTMYMLITDLSN